MFRDLRKNDEQHIASFNPLILRLPNSDSRVNTPKTKNTQHS
jgi:hypothetical protein